MGKKSFVAGLVLVSGLAASLVAMADSRLADAVMQRDSAAMKKLLADHADVNGQQSDGSTALQWAAYLDDLDAARELIKAGADVKIANEEGMTPLFLACQSGDAELVELLLQSGANANSTLSHGETPLMMAARTGNPAVLDVLIKHGADVNAKEKLRGTTALMWATAYARPNAVSFLVTHGADVAAHSAPIAKGRDPYLAPSARQRIEEVTGAPGTGPFADRLAARLRAETKAKAKGESNTQAQAAAATAAAAEDDSDADADAALVGSNLKPSADPQDAQKENLQRKLATEVADLPNAPVTPQNLRRSNKDLQGGLTPLVFAARQGDMKSVQILVDHGADVNETTQYGWTALLTATQNRYYQIGKYLLDHGANPNIANKGGWTPLYIATDNRNIEGGDYPVRKPDMDHLDFIKLLLAHGADPNMRMKSSTETRTVFTHQWLYEEGATPFLRAAQSGDLVLMKLLLEHGAKPGIPTIYNVTPLMVAAGIGWVEGVTYEWSPEQSYDTVKFLLDHGADVNAQDILDGRTALMGAAHKGRTDVVQLLVDHGADLSAHDIGSRDSIHNLAGVTWQAIDYADGLVRVGVQSAVGHPDTAALIRKLMEARGLPTPPEGRTLQSICVTPELCQ